MADVVRVGDVLRYTRGYATSEVWVLITDMPSGPVIPARLLKGKFSADLEEGVYITVGRNTSGREIVPPEKWPDDIAVAVARHYLGAGQ